MKAKGDIFQIKVKLLHSSPPIWRRIQVTSDTTLSELHYVIQVAMGWEDCHLHQFFVMGNTSSIPDPAGGTDFEDEGSVRLAKILRRRKSKMMYEYDFGDGWVHEIVLEDILPAEPGADYPVVVTGRRACPPEDCGGIWGYYRVLDAIEDPDHADHEEMKEWFEESFGPAEFYPEVANSIFRL